MEISKDIQTAEKNYPDMYHVVSSNEVHSFEKKSDAKDDLAEAIIIELKENTGFTPKMIYF